MKFWKKKDKSKSTNPFDDEDSTSFSTEYSQTPTAVSEPVKERYQAPPKPSTDNSRDRQYLFAGHQDPTNRFDSNGQEDAYRTSRLNEGEEDQEIQQIQRQIRNVKQDSLASTRNALQKIGEAEAAAANTMNMLGTQSSQIANVDRSLDLSKAYGDKASSQASELKQLNRSIFIPVIKNPFNKGSRERREMEKVQRNHQEHMEERDNIRSFEYKSSARIAEAHRKTNTEEKESFHRGRSQADRNRYQFEPDEEDDAVEDELDTNLDLLGDATSRLRTMATSMNEELTSQNQQLDKVTKKVDPISAKLVSVTHTLDSTR
ncbi:uncharacterized protein EV154DRAFT_472872 [Mucor mucedo]|uniref:uncharacterized protein n=1 Tax=Mucor mucedo TaxID=29922 RepID=UPI0022202928|nr:uncharacterized protein EV154DRAFT_472872 [Mucor mucedo]KAI7875083.1 hypothetical protein EV154DRAFT_472872 [Mucor mucedo]